MKTLGEQLPEETQRVRELMRRYQETQTVFGPQFMYGPTSAPQVMCGPAIYLMEQALQRADRAMIAGDVVVMARSLQELQEFEK